MAAAGRKVSKSNLRGPKTKPVRAVRQPRIPDPLKLPEVQSAVERLRSKYGPNRRTPQQEGLSESLKVSREQSRAERKLENAALRSLPTRGEALKAAPEVRAATRLNAEGTRVERLAGARQVGNEGLGAVQRAADRGKIRREGDRFTTPRVRQTRKKVKRAKRELRQARAATRTPKKNLMRAGLDAEQAQVLSTVLNIGRKKGASKKEMLAAVETALVESGIRNLGYGDADSSGWRQERAMYYPNPQNVRASAGRFFEETASQGRGAGMTAGQLAQAVQRSAFPEKYDQRKGEAVPLLRAFGSAGNASPKAKRRLARAEARAGSVARKAADLGLSVQGLVTPKQIKAMGINVNRQPRRPTLWAQPKKARGKGTVTWLNGTSADGINPDIIALARTVSRMTGQDIQITSALRPTDSDSNHSEGGALDINAVADGGAGERAGDAIAYAAVIAAGGTREQAEALASGAAGIVQFTSPNGHSLEMLWKGDPGHRDHVHIAVESPGRGKKVFRGRRAIRQGALVGGFSTPSYMGAGSSGGTSGGTTAGGGDTGGGGRKYDEPSVLETLRKLGFIVTPQGVRRTGLAAGVRGSTKESSEGETLTALKRKYKLR